ncbi:Lrp/AsnC family transcriptional regulator [Yinghuangia seranimata]|uniref:Lrp/AsnC family transcriptional regulator n=1 Tax=Yinghuangia seranimata TaxID=408067 RepID=UPI00248CAF62|nr:Lrp/AsnC family transcriptional regulator [Yinghuangia seranimata]MDI2127895.1 Lrp/AsnC family transcriptional regulator [Yinghuangia seranimata]
MPPTALDATDRRLLAELQSDARASYNELARRVGLSPPTVAERVRRMERAGVITGYHAHVDPAAAGRGVVALVRMNCYGPLCLLRRDADEVRDWPELLQLHRVTGDACCLLMVATPTMHDFQALIDRLADHGTPSSTMVLSSPVPWRAVDSPEPR